ncbi:hypothetical protein HY491_02315 [Candidatus Woesearchaeota archaeon]|nr:hypothetical protein [Candidatus Woesearchaeota archaeon]
MKKQTHASGKGIPPSRPPLILTLADWLAQQEGFQPGIPLHGGGAWAADIQNAQDRALIIEHSKSGLGIITNPEFSWTNRHRPPRKRVLGFIFLQKRGWRLALHGDDLTDLAIELANKITEVFAVKIAVEIVSSTPAYEDYHIHH